MALESLVKMDDKLKDLTLGDFIDILQDKGRDDKVEEYLFSFFMLSISLNVTPDEVLSMTLDDCINFKKAPPFPQGPLGWNTIWGKSVV